MVAVGFQIVSIMVHATLTADRVPISMLDFNLLLGKLKSARRVQAWFKLLEKLFLMSHGITLKMAWCWRTELHSDIDANKQTNKQNC